MRRLLLVGLALAALSCGRSSADEAPTRSLDVKGSDTMISLAQRWAAQFMKRHPGLVISVTGGGTGPGISALLDGTVDLATASRTLSASEKVKIHTKHNVDAVETPVALDALAVYVNQTNPLVEIDVETLGKIFKGEIDSWSLVGGKAHEIHRYGRESTSGTYSFFQEHVLDKSPFAPSTKALEGTVAIVEAVKGDELGIGYGGIGYAVDGVRLLRVSKVKGATAIEPKLETAQNGSYPLSRFLYVDSVGAPKGALGELVAWMKGAEGQRIVTEAGYFPLNK